MVNDDVYGYFYGDYANGDPRKTSIRRIVARNLERLHITSMNELCALSELEIIRLRGIGASRRTVLLEVLEQRQYRLNKRTINVTAFIQSAPPSTGIPLARTCEGRISPANETEDVTI